MQDLTLTRDMCLGDTTLVTMWVNACEDTRLHFTLSTRVAHRNGLETGVRLTVSLLSEGIQREFRRKRCEKGTCLP
jgi:hypothetical protein